MTTITQIIDELPIAPTRDDPVNFDARGDAMMAALPPMVVDINIWATQANTVAGEISANATAAASSATTATTKATEAVNAADDAVEAAASAVNAPGTSSASTTSMSLTAGTKNLTVATGKAFPHGSSVKIAYNVDVSKWMVGSVDTYDTSTGAMTVLVDADDIKSTGTFADWTVSVSGHRGAPAVNPDAGITNIVQSSTSYTLTATPTALVMTPTNHGYTVFLPNPSGITPIDPLHTITNDSSFDVRVCDYNKVLKGFIPPKTKCAVALLAATGAGTWGFSTIRRPGTGAKYIGTAMAYLIKVVSLDADRDVILSAEYNTSYLQATVHNKSTNEFGASVLVRAVSMGDGQGTADIVKSATNQLLVVSCPLSATTFEAVALSVSGVTITVNTAAPATLSANLVKFSTGCGLVAVDAGFVALYEVSTPQNQMRAMTISGTTVTIGSATVLSGTTAGAVQVVSGTKVIALMREGTTFYASPYSLSGTTLSIGTEYTSGHGAFTKVVALPTGRFLTSHTAVSCTLLSLSGTTVTGSNVASVTAGGGQIRDAIVVGNDKVLVVEDSTSLNCNIVTDSSGTAVKGTAITAGAGSTRNILYASGNKVLLNQQNNESIIELDCSGSSPLKVTTLAGRGGNTSGMIPYSASNAYSNVLLEKSPVLIFGSSFAATYGASDLGSNGTAMSLQLSDGVLSAQPPIDITGNLQPDKRIRGLNERERWAVSSYDGTPQTIIKLECGS